MPSLSAIGPVENPLKGQSPLQAEAESKRIDDFQADLAFGLRALLTSLGCTVPSDASPSEVALAYANYRFRRISAGPRRVHWSDTLSQQADLTSEELAAIRALAAKAAAGGDLYPHQSRGLTNPLSHDGLLADWGLHHLHLGLASGRPAPEPFVNRTNKVLITRFTDEDAYFLTAAPHGHGVAPPWWDIDLIEILHRNWRESIAAYELEGFAPKLSWQDHRNLRPRPGKGCNFTTAVSTADGTSYMLSCGLVAAGYSLDACGRADAIQNHVTDIAIGQPDGIKLVVYGDHRELRFRLEPR